MPVPHAQSPIRLMRLTGCHAGVTPGVGAREANYARQMSPTAGVRRVRDYFRSYNLRIRVLLPTGLLIVALAAGCASSAPTVSDERAEVLADVVERWILEVEDLRIVLEGVTDANSSVRSIRDVRSRVNAMRSIMLEAGERSDDDEAYVQAEFGDRARA